jgi:hypothetical protein
MGNDYYKYAHILDDFELKLIKANPEFITGKTGYENYYLDLISDNWRNLYNPEIAIEDEDYYHDGDYKYWNKMVYLAP